MDSGKRNEERTVKKEDSKTTATPESNPNMQKDVKGGEEPCREGKTVMDILKSAYKDKLIEQMEYENAVHKLLKTEVTGDCEDSLTEFKIFKDGEGVQMILERGEIDIPTNSHIAVKKEGEHLLIRSTIKGGGGTKRVDDSPETVVLKEDIPLEKKEEVDSTDLEDLEAQFQSPVRFSDTGMRNGTGTLKEDLELIDLRREFQSGEYEKEELPKEEKKKEEDRGILDGVIDRFLKVTGRFKEEGEKDKLKRLSLENMGKVKTIKEERRALIGIAYVLKQFLEVKYNLPREVTYHELVYELKGKNMDKQLKEQLMDFFEKMPLMMYARAGLPENLPRAYTIAERTINELSA
ncbi:MAG: hypothetical protein JW724_07195 [Candidatus Altiarchaeota archaeon]|nr:hypothetical protein [Candidatus Altiarchaeota archaeon]